MTFNPQDMTNLLPVIAQFAQIPVEKWGENLEPQSHTILKVGDALVGAWENKTLVESDYPTARQFLYDCSHFLAHRPEHHRPNWLEMGVAIAQDDEARAWFLACLGGLNIHWGEYRKALGYYGDALTIYHNQQNVAREGRMLSGIGLVWLMLDEPKKSSQYYHQSLTLLEQTDNKKYQIIANNELGVVYNWISEWELSKEHIQKALDMSREIGDLAEEATSLNNLAWIEGDYSLALQYFDKALAFHRQTGHKPCEAVTLSNIASVFIRLALPIKALPYAESSLQVAQMLRNKHYEVTALISIGLIMKQLGRHKEALTYCEQALALTGETQGIFDQAEALAAIAQVWNAMAKPQKALDYYEQAVQIIENTDYHLYHLGILTKMADLYFLHLGVAKSFPLFEDMIVIADEWGDDRISANMRISYASALHRKRQWDRAIAITERAIMIFIDSGIEKDSCGFRIDHYQLFLRRLYGGRNGWFYKLFPFL